MAPFPWATVTELREKYTYDIHPFATFKTEKKTEKIIKSPVKQQGKILVFQIRIIAEKG